MSERDEETPKRQPRRGGGFGPGGGHGMSAPAEKSKDFKGSGKRLLGLLRPHWLTIAFIIVLAIFSVGFSVAGPKILGAATNVLFQGVLSHQYMTPGVTQAQVEAQLRSTGQDQLAQKLSSMTLTPSGTVDFTLFAKLLVLLAAVYILSAVLGWLQQYLTVGMSQGIVKRRASPCATSTRIPAATSSHA